jgi:homospermidine synthase
MKIAILGIGAVGKCCLHLIYHFFDIDPHDVYLIERSNPRTHYAVNAFIQRGAIYLERNLNRENAAIQAFDLPKTSTTSGCWARLRTVSV